MRRLGAWLAGPVVCVHVGCVASPAFAMALGLPIVMPICGGDFAGLLSRVQLFRDGTPQLVRVVGGELPEHRAPQAELLQSPHLAAE